MRCRLWLAVSCLIVSSAVGCSRAEESASPAGTGASPPQAQQEPISEEERQAIIRSEHDEPVVVDNAPMKISLSKYATKEQNYDWIRHFDRFATLHIIPRDANGDPIGEDETFRLCYECTVTLVMKENGNQPAGTEERIDFKPDKAAHKLTMTPSREYELKNNKRLIPKDAPQLRLVRIEFTKRDATVPDKYEFADGNNYKYKNVEIILLGTAP